MTVWRAGHNVTLLSQHLDHEYYYQGNGIHTRQTVLRYISVSSKTPDWAWGHLFRSPFPIREGTPCTPVTCQALTVTFRTVRRGNTVPWLVDNQSRDLNNELWLVVYLRLTSGLMKSQKRNLRPLPGYSWERVTLEPGYHLSHPLTRCVLKCVKFVSNVTNYIPK